MDVCCPAALLHCAPPPFTSPWALAAVSCSGLQRGMGHYCCIGVLVALGVCAAKAKSCWCYSATGPLRPMPDRPLLGPGVLGARIHSLDSQEARRGTPLGRPLVGLRRRGLQFAAPQSWASPRQTITAHTFAQSAGPSVIPPSRPFYSPVPSSLGLNCY